MLSYVIYSVLTVLIPAHLTYEALKGDKGEGNLSIWSNYWAYFAFIQLLRYFFTFLTYQPFEFVLLLLHIWLYSEQYRGGLYLSNLIHKAINANHLDQHIDILAKNIQPLNVFEKEGAPENADPSLPNAKND